MNKVLLVYWPLKGNVETVASKISEKLKDHTLIKKPITEVTADDMHECNNWIVGGSTVGSHVWMDADDSNKWFEFFKLMDGVAMDQKIVGFYGLGDQILYPHHYVDGLGVFQEEFEKRNAKIVGQWPVEGYQFYDSEGVIDNKFMGLAIDEDQQPELTDERITAWLHLIKPAFKSVRL